MGKLFYTALFVLMAMLACQEKPVTPDPDNTEDEEHVLYCGGGFCAYGELVEEGNIYVKGDRAWLWGGDDSSWHFSHILFLDSKEP